MSKHEVITGPWAKPEAYYRPPGGGGRRRGVGVVVALLLGAIAIGLSAGWMLQPKVDDANGKPDAPIEWNAVQAAPKAAPDAEDAEWKKRAEDEPSPSWGGLGGGQQSFPSATDVAGPPPTSPTRGEAIKVIDGDTFDINGTRVRVAGIDAPERHPARCPQEAQLGAAAAQKLAELLRGGPLWISGNQTDRYGRSVRTVRVGGEDVADAMISSGLARNYDGKKRQSWC